MHDRYMDRYMIDTWMDGYSPGMGLGPNEKKQYVLETSNIL